MFALKGGVNVSRCCIYIKFCTQAHSGNDYECVLRLNLMRSVDGLQILAQRLLFVSPLE